MNRIMQTQFPVFEMYRELRDQLMAALTDDDLRFRPVDHSPTLGDLCRRIGEVEHSYIESFRTFEHDFTYRADVPDIERSVEKLTTWYRELDGTLKEVLGALSDEDIEKRQIKRGDDFFLPIHIQLGVYQEALLIFYGKASVYLQALGKTPPQRFQEWIG